MFLSNTGVAPASSSLLCILPDTKGTWNSQYSQCIQQNHRKSLESQRRQKIMDVGCSSVFYFPTSSDILTDYRVTGGIGKFGGLLGGPGIWGSQDYRILGGFWGFWGAPGILGGSNSWETPRTCKGGDSGGAKICGGARSGGTRRVGKSWEFNQHLSQSILHCASGGFSKGRKDGQTGQYLFLGRESWVGLSYQLETSPALTNRPGTSVNPVWFHHPALGLGCRNPTARFLISLSLFWHHQPIASMEMMRKWPQTWLQQWPKHCRKEKPGIQMCPNHQIVKVGADQDQDHPVQSSSKYHHAH